MKFNKKPTIPKSKDIFASVDNEALAKKFIFGATILDQEQNSISEKPERKKWEEINIEKETTILNFRIPKKDMQQLKYISNERKMSLNSLCLMAIQEQNKKLLKDFE